MADLQVMHVTLNIMVMLKKVVVDTTKLKFKRQQGYRGAEESRLVRVQEQDGQVLSIRCNVVFACWSSRGH